MKHHKAVDHFSSKARLKKQDRKFVFTTFVALFFLFTGGLAGCGGKKRIENAQELAEDGMQSFEDEDYGDALESFTTLKERYPYSRYAILAELKVADAHFYRAEYPEAIAAYESFANLHPKNEAIPYVLYQIGECNYKQLLSEDRDQTPTHLAILAFERVIREHPNSNYTLKARKKIQTSRELLAKHELYVARFYYKSEHYRAALARFQGALDTYYDVINSDTQQEVEQLILACKEKLAEIIE
jgi:outer membrane protein assembly factor BamD